MPSRLDREEYVEQAYFFRLYRERTAEGVAAQEVMEQALDELLASTKLPIALKFLTSVLVDSGGIAAGMRQLAHYFTPFQAFVMTRAEEEAGRFEMRIALSILEREAEYRAGGVSEQGIVRKEATQAGLFLYQFESLARNRLGYGDGLAAVGSDPFYEAEWVTWIKRLPNLLGSLDVPTLVYSRSELYAKEQERRARPNDSESDDRSPPPVLFGVQEGRIAKANRGRDPLYFFAALQRQLGYPAVPKPAKRSGEQIFHPALEARLQRIEKQLAYLDAEQKGTLDLDKLAKEQWGDSK